MWGFPGGSVVKNLLATAGDTGLSPDPGRSHMLQLRSKIPHATTKTQCSEINTYSKKEFKEVMQIHDKVWV